MFDSNFEFGALTQEIDERGISFRKVDAEPVGARTVLAPCAAATRAAPAIVDGISYSQAGTRESSKMHALAPSPLEP
jgi:hypothetical protein